MVYGEVSMNRHTSPDREGLSYPKASLQKALLFLVLVIALPALAGATDVTQCQLINAAGEYTLTQSITNGGTCINITASNVLLDCQGFTITYGTGGGVTGMGIDATNGANAMTNLTIKDCTIKKPSPLQASCYGIRLTRYNSSRIINNTIYTNGTTTNFGIYLTTNAQDNLIENNTIYANGTSTGSAGIYLVTASSNNVLRGNNITTFGTTTAYGIWISTNSSNNTIQQNAIWAYGSIGATTYAYGIYVATNAMDTRIIQNNINSSGNGNNYGIYLQNNVTRTNISGNEIYARGTSGNYGIHLLGTTTLPVNETEIESNFIRTGGNSSTNLGIYLYNNINATRIKGNTILTNGTTTNHGIYCLGVANGPCDNNTITENTIVAWGTSGTAAEYGVYAATNANSNNISQNSIRVGGITTLYGIHILGTTLQTNGTTITKNNITTSGNGASNHGIYVFNNASGTIIRENIISVNGTTPNYGIWLSGANLAANDCDISGNNITTNGTGASNFGIYVYRNSSRNNITNNTIFANGTTTNYGIIVAGTTNFPTNDNRIENNSVYTDGLTAGTNPGIVLATNANRNNITDNYIKARGATTQNFGIYLTGSATLSVDQNRIESNTILTNGTTTNIGIYLLTNTNRNNITRNSITTNGTSSNVGIYLSGTTSNADNNIIIENNISAGGTAGSNYGIYLYRNVSNTNITSNMIFTYGTSANHGVYATGTAAMRTDNSTIDRNCINATGAGAAVSNYGITFYNFGNQNNITNNNVSINGTSANYGIYLIGANNVPVNDNLIYNNNVLVRGTTTANYGVYITTAANRNNITNNTITLTGTGSNIGLYLLGATTLTSDNTTIQKNTITLACTLTANYGMLLSTNTNGNTITDNNISTSGTSTNHGLYISGSAFRSNNNTITDNNIFTNSTIDSNYGLYLYRNTSNNTIARNSITTRGNSLNHGVYAVGAAGLPVDSNTISQNTINASGTAGASTNYGLYLTSNVGKNTILQNNITTQGTTANYGIHLLGAAGLPVNQNTIQQNILFANGTGTNNDCIYLLTNANQNIIINNSITTTGTTGNIGIAVSGTTVASNQNSITANTIRTNGTTTAYGILLTTNALLNNITSNDILTNGTTTSHGIYLVGAANAQVNRTLVSDNVVETRCSQAIGDCYGIYLQNLVTNNNFTSNTITTAGTAPLSNNFGIHLIGAAATKVESNIFERNSISSTGADRIRINTFAMNTTFRNNSILARDSVTYDLNVLAAEANVTQLIDQSFENYNFGGSGEAIRITNTSFGEIQFLGNITGNGSSLSQNIRIANNYIYVNGSVAGLNKSARLTLYNMGFSKPVILRDNILCTDCPVVSNSGGNLAFNVSRFSAYSASENAKLEIWDDSDSLPVRTNELTGVYANYTNSTSGETISGSGIGCNVTFSDIGMRQMAFNATDGIYWYNRTFGSGGNKFYNVACEDTDDNFATLNATDYVTIESVQGPRNPSNITLIGSEQGNITSDPGLADAQAGNLSLIDLNMSAITGYWQGYFGQVGGTVYLTDPKGSSMYNWSIFAPAGEVYATRALDVNFEEIDCSNSSEIADEETYLGIIASDPESVSNTFAKNSHPEFNVGSFIVNADTCNSTNPFVNNTAQDDAFYEVLLSDASANLVYVAILDANHAGFDNGNYDFEMLVAENGTDPSLTTYYFFIEIT
jgi:hypothetical protein